MATSPKHRVEAQALLRCRTQSPYSWAWKEKGMPLPFAYIRSCRGILKFMELLELLYLLLSFFLLRFDFLLPYGFKPCYFLVLTRYVNVSLYPTY